MHSRVWLVAAGLAGWLAAAPAAGQGALCCNLLVDVGGDWKGALRSCEVALQKADPQALAKACTLLEDCPEAQAGCFGCDQERIARLKGRIRGLGEAGKAHHKSLNAAREKRIAARDVLWGKGQGLYFEGGAIADFGKATLGVLAIGNKPLGNVLNQFDEMAGWAQTAWNVGAKPDEVNSWVKAGEKLLGEEADDILKRRTHEAWVAARARYWKTGNYVSGANVYKQKIGNYGGLKQFKKGGLRFADALKSLAEMWEKTDALADGLQDWIDAYRDHKAADKDIAKVEAEIDRLTKLKQALEAACGTAPQSRLRLPAARLHLVATAPESEEKREAKRLQLAQSALLRVKAVHRVFERLDRNVGKQIIAPLSPWLAGVSHELEPRAMLVELVKGSRADFNSFRSALGHLEAEVTQAYQSVQALPRDPIR
ncbi:MAG TPA: hypothetical protein VF211_01405 [Burkholderiales bacterium]